MFKKLSNIGDCGIVCDFGEEVNRSINTEVIKLFHYVKKQSSDGNLLGILNCTPSYNKLIINFDLNKTNTNKIIDFLKSVDFSKLNLSEDKKEWIIPICYDFEMDLEKSYMFFLLAVEGGFQPFAQTGLDGVMQKMTPKQIKAGTIMARKFDVAAANK